MDRQAELNEMLDHFAIKKLMVRYAERIDANDPAGAAACFAPDGIGHYWGEYQGRAAITERLTGILDQFAATSHHLSNVMLDVDGDSATGLSYVYAFHRYVPSLEPLHVWGRWVDRIVRIDGEWLFARREVSLVGRMEPGDPPLDIPYANAFPGHPGRMGLEAAE